MDSASFLRLTAAGGFAFCLEPGVNGAKKLLISFLGVGPVTLFAVSMTRAGGFATLSILVAAAWAEDWPGLLSFGAASTTVSAATGSSAAAAEVVGS